MLRTALGPSIAGYLEDPSIVEVMLNPDGRLWIDRLSGGLEDTGCRVTPADAERIVRLVAHHVGVEVHAGSPRVSAELPESGERFEGLVPPVVAAPCFAIRRPAVAVFTLGDYVQAGIITGGQAELLRLAGSDTEAAVHRRQTAAGRHQQSRQRAAPTAVRGGCHGGDPPSKARQQDRLAVAAAIAGTPTAQARGGGSGQQDGPHGVGHDDEWRGVADAQGFRRSLTRSSAPRVQKGLTRKRW